MKFSPKTKRTVLERFGHKCCVCGAQRHLHAHHIVPQHVYSGEGSASSLNGLAVCSSCHMPEFHKGRWKKSNIDRSLKWARQSGLNEDVLLKMRQHCLKIASAATKSRVYATTTAPNDEAYLLEQLDSVKRELLEARRAIEVLRAKVEHFESEAAHFESEAAFVTESRDWWIKQSEYWASLHMKHMGISQNVVDSIFKRESGAGAQNEARVQ